MMMAKQPFFVIDFNKVSTVVVDAFDKYLNDLDTFFMILSAEYNVALHARETMIVFNPL